MNNSSFAPVIIFAYRRPDHLKSTLLSLMRCTGFEQSQIIVYVDGPRDSSEVDDVNATRKIAQDTLGSRGIYHFSSTNQGLAKSVITGVTEVVSRYGKAIVVEDDLTLSPHFLRYMNLALTKYEACEEVFQISGFSPEVPELKNTTEGVFLPFTVSWGWGTWKRAWDKFDVHAAGWEQLLRDVSLRKKFNLDNSYDYTTMLHRQMLGLRDSWAIRWYWSAFNAKGLTLFPPTSLVRNTGFDGTGTHGRALLRRVTGGCALDQSLLPTLPNSIEVSEYYDAVKRAIWKQNGGYIGFIADKIRKIFD